MAKNRIMNLEELKKPLNYRWRVQSFSKNKAMAMCVAYVDSRDVQNRLDEVCGIGKWMSDYKEINGIIYGGIGIYIDDLQQWVWKWDAGKESDIEKEKGQASDAFKRAAVKWGIARDIYEFDLFMVKANDKKTDNNKPYPINDEGKRIYNLTDYIEPLRKHKPVWWSGAIEYMSKGGNIEEIEKKYKLQPEWKQELLNA